jgi:dimethylhistidine N-methyltransferase
MLSADSLTLQAPSPLEVSDALRDAVCREALAGLLKASGAQKTLSPWLFYDEPGSHLFEQITALPEYYLTRTERAIFARYADEIFLELASNVTIAELGAGTATKTGLLLEAATRFQQDVLYQPIDISSTALDEACLELAAHLPDVGVEPQVANYITDTYTITRPRDHRVLALYIGSSIGNFSPPDARAILRNLRQHIKADDALLLGVDLAPGKGKSVDTLLSAYDDAAGVTAAFNKNVLTRLNREIGADFPLSAFAHRARWNAAESRIEMHLESLAAQTVHIAGNRITFAEGETIHTENSYKFTDAALRALLDDSGFAPARTFHDDGRCFAVTLATAV